MKEIKNIRIEPELWTQAKIAALKQGIDLQDWVAEAIAEKLGGKK